MPPDDATSAAGAGGLPPAPSVPLRPYHLPGKAWLWPADRVRALRWIRILVRGGLALQAALIVRSLLAGTLEQHVHWRASRWVAPVGSSLVAILVGVGVGLYAYRTLGDIKPRRNFRVRGRPTVTEWVWLQAKHYGQWTGLGVWIVVLAPVIEAFEAVQQVMSIPEPGRTVLYWSLFALTMLAALWATVLAGAVCHDTLARQIRHRPLRPLADLTKRARELARRADEVREAMNTTVAMEEELREAIEAEQRALDEIQQQIVDHEATAAITMVRSESVRRTLAADQRDERRRSFWSGLVVNVAVGFVFYVLGVLTPALVNAEALRTLLR